MAEPKQRPPGPLNTLTLASRMQADQQGERHQDNIASRSLEDILGEEDQVLLQQKTRSYAQPQTATDAFMEEQRGMRRTARQFLTPNAAAERHQQPLTREEVPRSERQGADEPDEMPERSSAEERDQKQYEQAQAIRMAQEQQRAARERDTKEADKQQKLLERAANFIRDTKKEFRTIRQIAQVGSGVGMIPLILELNVQMASTLLGFNFGGLGKKASKPKMAATCCIDTLACFGLGPMFILMAVFGIILAYVASASIADQLRLFFEYVVPGLF